MATSGLLESCKNKDSAAEILQHLVRAANLALFLLPVLIKTLEYFYLHYENQSIIFYVMQKLRQSDRMTPYSSIRVTEHFFNMQIKFRWWRWNILKSRALSKISQHLCDDFLSTFLWTNQTPKRHHQGLNLHPSGLQLSTLPLCLIYFLV